MVAASNKANTKKMQKTLNAAIRRRVPVMLAKVGELDVWVRADPTQMQWDLEMIRPILERDEYELLPIKNDGHVVTTVVDVGGHIGSFTLRAKSLWPDSTVIAAEPDPETAALFRENTAHLPGVLFHELALVGSGRGPEVHFCEIGRDGSRENTAKSFVVEAVRGLNPDTPCPTPTCVVAAAPLSRLLRAYGVQEIDVLKLDCEGSEAEVLEDLSSAGFLERSKWIRGEWHHVTSIPRITQVLAPTHVASIVQDTCPWGYFIAHRRWGTDPKSA